MKIDNVFDGGVSPPIREQLDALRRSGAKKAVSQWIRLDAGEVFTFIHNLKEIPFVVDVLASSDSQGSDQTSATDVTTSKTDKIVTVTNVGAARFFRVRAS